MKRSTASFALFLWGCQAAPAGGVSSAAPPASTPGAAAKVATSAPAPAASVQAPTASASAPAPSASSSASASAASPCPDGGRADVGARFCVKLPEKFLAVSYEELPDQSVNEELQLSGGPYLRISRAIAQGMTVAKLRAIVTPDDGLIVDRGELPEGYWREYKGDGKLTVVAEILSGKLVVTCTGTAPLDQVQRVRDVCRTLRAF